MTTDFRNMTVEHLGSYATEQDLTEFVALCEEVAYMNPQMDDDEVTEAVYGDGDYFANAKKLGVRDVSRFFLMPVVR